MDISARLVQECEGIRVRLTKFAIKREVAGIGSFVRVHLKKKIIVG